MPISILSTPQWIKVAEILRNMGLDSKSLHLIGVAICDKSWRTVEVTEKAQEFLGPPINCMTLEVCYFMGLAEC